MDISNIIAACIHILATASFVFMIFKLLAKVKKLQEQLEIESKIESKYESELTIGIFDADTYVELTTKRPSITFEMEPNEIAIKNKNKIVWNFNIDNNTYTNNKVMIVFKNNTPHFKFKVNNWLVSNTVYNNILSEPGSIIWNPDKDNFDDFYIKQVIN